MTAFPTPSWWTTSHHWLWQRGPTFTSSWSDRLAGRASPTFSSSQPPLIGHRPPPSKAYQPSRKSQRRRSADDRVTDRLVARHVPPRLLAAPSHSGLSHFQGVERAAARWGERRRIGEGGTVLLPCERFRIQRSTVNKRPQSPSFRTPLQRATLTAAHPFETALSETVRSAVEHLHVLGNRAAAAHRQGSTDHGPQIYYAPSCL